MRRWFGMQRRCFALSPGMGWAIPIALLVTACATSKADLAGSAAGGRAAHADRRGRSPSPVAEPPQPPPPEPAVCKAFARPGVLKRSAVVRVVDAGIGRWLAGGVEVERKIAKSRFQGWEIRRLYPGDPCYVAVDLRPLDVVILE